jgi:hypothetical protein
MKKAIFVIAESEAQAVGIFNQLLGAGFSDNDISALFPDMAETRHFAHEQHTKAPEGAAAGAGSGVVIGGALGWLVGMGALVIPGVGPFIAAGPIMAALAGVLENLFHPSEFCSIFGMNGHQNIAALHSFFVLLGFKFRHSHPDKSSGQPSRSSASSRAGAVTAAEDAVDRAHGRPSAPAQAAVSSAVQEVRDPPLPELDPAV